MSGFFDKIKYDMGIFVSAAGVKAGEIATNAKSSLEILGLKKQKDEALFELGKKVYDMYLKNRLDQDKIISECKNATLLDEEIKLVKERIRQEQREAKKAYKRANHKKNSTQ